MLALNPVFPVFSTMIKRAKKDNLGSSLMLKENKMKQWVISVFASLFWVLRCGDALKLDGI